MKHALASKVATPTALVAKQGLLTETLVERLRRQTLERAAELGRGILVKARGLGARVATSSHFAAANTNIVPLSSKLAQKQTRGG